LAFFAAVLTARLLGASGFGIFSLAVACTTIAAIVARLGIDNAVVRQVSASAAQKEIGTAFGTHSAALKLTLPVSLAVALLIILSAPKISIWLFDQPELAGPLRVAAITTVPITVIILCSESLRALKMPGRATFLQAAMQPMLTVGALLFLMPFSIGWTPTRMTLLKFLVTVAVAGASWFFFRSLRRRISPPNVTVPLRPLFSASVPLLWIMLIGVTITTVDIFMLGIWVDAQEVGLYAAAVQVANVMILLLVAINGVAGPKFSELHVQGRIEVLSTVARYCALLGTLLALPVYLMILAIPERFMGLFGEEFSAGSSILAILATGQFINIATGSVSLLLMMTGYERTLQRITVGTGLLNIAMNAALIPTWGGIGAAIATTISVATLNIAGLVMVYRKLSIWMIWFHR